MSHGTATHASDILRSALRSLLQDLETGDDVWVERDSACNSPTEEASRTRLEATSLNWSERHSGFARTQQPSATLGATLYAYSTGVPVMRAAEARQLAEATTQRSLQGALADIGRETPPTAEDLQSRFRRLAETPRNVSSAGFATWSASRMSRNSVNSVNENALSVTWASPVDWEEAEFSPASTMQVASPMSPTAPSLPDAALDATVRTIFSETSASEASEAGMDSVEAALDEVLRRLTGANAQFMEEAFRTVRAVEMALALSEANIEALPKVRFGHPDAPEESSCSICLEQYQDGNLLTELPNCGHFFHVECIGRWLRANNQCPLCRRSQGS
eukprot:s1341_g24.t1